MKRGLIIGLILVSLILITGISGCPEKDKPVEEEKELELNEDQERAVQIAQDYVREEKIPFGEPLTPLEVKKIGAEDCLGCYLVKLKGPNGEISITLYDWEYSSQERKFVKDAKGCIRALEYSWNETLDVCLKESELDNNQRRAALIALDSLRPFNKYEEKFVVVDVTAKDPPCEGCYQVNLGRTRNSVFITLENWEFVSQNEIYQ